MISHKHIQIHNIFPLYVCVYIESCNINFIFSSVIMKDKHLYFELCTQFLKYKSISPSDREIWLELRRSILTTRNSLLRPLMCVIVPHDFCKRNRSRRGQ